MAEALDQSVKEMGPEGDGPLFDWGHAYAPRVRSTGGARLAAEQDAAEREELAQREAEARARAEAATKQAQRWGWGPTWSTELAVALLGLLLAGILVAWLLPGQREALFVSSRASREGGRAAVGDSAEATPASALAPMLTESQVKAVGLPLPENPFPGQRRPPCNRYGEVEIRGGCWYRLGDAPSPCREDAYDWKGACYLPPGAPGAKPLPRSGGGCRASAPPRV